MARIRTFNTISPAGIDVLVARGHEVGSDIENPDGILVRSAALHDLPFGDGLRAIARAGAGVNNIPVDRCTGAGIVVFNTPGSNANSVKELVVAGLLLASRDIIGGTQWALGLRDHGDDVPALVEKGKSDFAGPELAGKTLGVIGLGAIGVMVANVAEALGMNVIGFDPYLSVENAWGLSRAVRRAESLEGLLAQVDYLTLHAPLNDGTRGMIDGARIGRAKRGIRILNFARAELVDTPAIIAGIASGAVERYVTDFPTAELLGNERVIPVPHLGASTPEAETNSAVMAAVQLADYLESGVILNSVNLPECMMERGAGDRLTLANRNIPNMVGQITTALAEAGCNIADMLNRHRGEVAYNIIDVDGTIPQNVVDRLAAIDGVVMARVIPGARG